MAGAVAQQAPAPVAAEDKAAVAQAQADAAQQAVNSQVMSAYRTQADRQGAPVQQYYQPQASVAGQSPSLRMPGFQGVVNPFYTPAAQPQQQKAGSQAQAAALLNQYNAYKQNNANALYQSRAAQLAQSQAMQKAYQDKMAADKAKAEAAAAEAERQRAMNPWGGLYGDGGGYANGGIADLDRGFK